MFYGIKYLIVTLVFSHLGFWSGNLFLIASFPDLCLLVPFYLKSTFIFFFFFFFVLRLNIPVNNFSVMSGRSQLFLGLTSTVGS